MSTETPDLQPQRGPVAPPPAAFPPPIAPPPVFAVAAARPRRRVTLTSILLAAAAVIAVAGIAFAVGRVTAPAPVAAGNGLGRAFGGGGNGGTFPGGGTGGTGGGFGGGAGGLDLRGTVIAVNGDTLTVQLANGRSIQVKTSSSTTYHTQTSGSASDVSNGASVIVQVEGGTGLRGLFGQGAGGGTASISLPAADITVTGR